MSSEHVTIEDIVPKGAGAWQLYSGMNGVQLAASSLSRSLLASFKRLQKVPAADFKVALQKEIEAFSDRRDKWSRFGASDTEPRNVGLEAYERLCSMLGICISIG